MHDKKSKDQNRKDGHLESGVEEKKTADYYNDSFKGLNSDLHSGTTAEALDVELVHQTRYQFDRPTVIMPHIIRLRPAPHCKVPVALYALKINPEPTTRHWQQDAFSNTVVRLFFSEPADALDLEVTLVARLLEINPFDFFIETEAETFPVRYDDLLLDGLAPYLSVKENGPLLKTLLAEIDQSPIPTVDFLDSVNKIIWQHVRYIKRMETGVQNCELTIDSAQGSCRDSAWLLIQILRHLGFATRFVSGYQVQLDIDVSLEHPEQGQDCVDLHAWAEVYIPGAGWLGLDPSTGMFATGHYIPLACTPHPESAAPITGKTSPCEVSFSYSSTVRRLQ